MLKNKEIQSKFGIATKTLYNWSRSRKELYNFLKKSDDLYCKSRDLNIILRLYEKNISPVFTKSELEFFIELDYKSKPTDFFENFPEKFLELCKKRLMENQKIIVDILPKITQLTIVEIYILLDKINMYKEKQNSKDKEIDMKEYFKYLFGVFYLHS